MDDFKNTICQHSGGSRGQRERVTIGGAARFQTRLMAEARRAILKSSLRVVVYGILASVPVLFAAVQPWVWAWYVAAIYAAFGLSLWRRPLSASAPGAGSLAGAGVFLGWTLLLALPLPMSLVEALAPFRARVLAQAGALAGGAPAWASLGWGGAEGLAWWGLLLALALWYAVLRDHLCSRRHLALTAGLIFAVAAAEALYGLLQALEPSLGVLWVDYIPGGLGNARGTWINRNHFAGFLEMTIPLGLALVLSQVTWGGRTVLKTFFTSDRPQRQFLLTMGLAVMVLALLFSKSRAGIAGGFLGFGVFVLLARRGTGRLPLSAWLVIGGLAALVAFYAGRIGTAPIVERFLALDNLESGKGRLDFWRDSLAMVADHPAGIGLAAFERVFAVYNVSSMIDQRVVDHLHNDVLQLLVEGGAVGFAALVGGFLWFMARRLARLRRMRLHADPLRYFLAAGAFSGLTALGFHSFFDFNLQIPANMFYFVALLGILDAATDRKSADDADGRKGGMRARKAES
jgi:O-antigen ligase